MVKYIVGWYLYSNDKTNLFINILERYQDEFVFIDNEEMQIESKPIQQDEIITICQSEETTSSDKPIEWILPLVLLFNALIHGQTFTLLSRVIA